MQFQKNLKYWDKYGNAVYKKSAHMLSSVSL